MELVRLYLDTENEIERLQAQQERLRSSREFVLQFEFYEKLSSLLAQNGKTLVDAVRILDPRNPLVTGVESTPKIKQKDRSPRVRGPVNSRQEYIYTNPHTGERLKYTAGPHRLKRAWENQYTKEVVKTWRKKADE